MVAFYLVCLIVWVAILGVITLACLPRLRLNFANVMLFIPGALAGFIGLQKLFFILAVKIGGPKLADKLLSIPYSYLVTAVFCQVLGGILVVASINWLVDELDLR